MRFNGGKFPVGAVRNNRLTRLKTQLDAIDLHGNDVWLEGYQARHAADFRKCLAIRPCRQVCFTNVEIATHSLIRQKISSSTNVNAESPTADGSGGLDTAEQHEVTIRLRGHVSYSFPGVALKKSRFVIASGSATRGFAVTQLRIGGGRPPFRASGTL